MRLPLAFGRWLDLTVFRRLRLSFQVCCCYNPGSSVLNQSSCIGALRLYSADIVLLFRYFTTASHCISGSRLLNCLNSSAPLIAVILPTISYALSGNQVDFLSNVMVTDRWSDDSSTCVNGPDIFIRLLEITKFRVEGLPYPVVMRVGVSGPWM